jgi:hypothetical protein
MRAIMSFGRGGADAFRAGGAALNMPKAWTMGGRSCETVVGSVATWGRGLQSTPPPCRSACTGWVILNKVQKASLVM